MWNGSVCGWAFARGPRSRRGLSRAAGRAAKSQPTRSPPVSEVFLPLTGIAAVATIGICEKSAGRDLPVRRHPAGSHEMLGVLAGTYNGRRWGTEWLTQ